MAILQFEMKDKHGNDLDIGDEIILKFESVDIYDEHSDYEYYRGAATVRAKIFLPPSSGLQVKILEVIECESTKDFMVGERKPFKRTVMDFEKVIP